MKPLCDTIGPDVHICAQISFSVFKHKLDADSLTLRHSMVYSPLYEEESCQASISLCTFYLRLAEQPGWQEEFLFFTQWMKYKVSSYDFYSKSSTWLCKLCSIINAERIALGIKDWALLLWYPEKVIPACPHRDSGSQFPFFLISFNHSSFHFGNYNYSPCFWLRIKVALHKKPQWTFIVIRKCLHTLECSGDIRIILNAN